jgi:hypothetical protein
VDEEEQRRAEMMQHNFGNPFALKKKQRGNKKSLGLDVTAIDEADLGVTPTSPDLEIGSEAKFMKERHGVKRSISVTGPVNDRPAKRLKTDASIAMTPVNTASPTEDKSQPAAAEPPSVTVTPVNEKPAPSVATSDRRVKDVKRTPTPNPLKASVKSAPAVDSRELVAKYRAAKTQLARLVRTPQASVVSVLRLLDELALEDRRTLAAHLAHLAQLYRRSVLADSLLNYHKAV